MNRIESTCGSRMVRWSISKLWGTQTWLQEKRCRWRLCFDCIPKRCLADMGLLICERCERLYLNTQQFFPHAKQIVSSSKTFALASRKPFLVAGFLILYERGLVDLHAPISKFLPEFEAAVVGAKRWKRNMVGMEPVVGFDWMNDGCNVWTVLNETHDQRKKMTHTAAQQLWCCFRVPLVRPISVHDLLAHTSGIGFGPGFGYEPENAYEISYVPLVRKVDLGEIQSLAEWCQELAKVPLRLVRGIQIHYACRFFLSSCITTIQMK